MELTFEQRTQVIADIMRAVNAANDSDANRHKRADANLFFSLIEASDEKLRKICKEFFITIK